MATCRVKRNNSGRITKVTNEDGTEARLYNTIVKHPMIQNEDEALEVYKNTLVENKVGENPTFTHRVNGEMVASYKTALDRTREGDLIEIGFQSDKGFQPIVSVNKTTDRNTREGFINYFISENVLSESKKMTKDGYKFKAAGHTFNAQVVNAELLRDSAGAYLGTRGMKKDGSTFAINKTNDKARVIDHKGNLTEVSREELDNMTYEELQKLTPYALDYIAAREYANNRPSYGFVQEEVVLPSRTENELQVLLLNLLNKMGVSTMSISQYVEKYNVKNGVDPSAEALADISNKVVAFHEGEMGLEALTEEVAHFITEAMPQDQVESILANIHKSEEWSEHADAYRDVYSKQYEGEALEDAVRREVLGKVMTNSILNQFNTEGRSAAQTTFIAQALDLITKFFERIQAYFRPEYKTQLDNYLENVQEILRADEIANKLNTDNFEGNNKVLFSTKGVPKSSISLSAQKAVTTIRDQIQSSLARAKKGSSVNKQKLQRLNEKLEENEEIGAVADITSLSNNYITMLTKAIEDAKKNGKSYIFTQEENIIFQALKNQLIPSLEEIKGLIKERKDNKAEWKNISKEIDDTIINASELNGIAANQESTAINNLIDKIMIRHELPDSSREYLEKWVETAEAETNWFHANFGMLTHSRDGLLNLAGMLQKDIATQSNINWQDATKKYQQRLKALGISEQEVSQFVDGQFIVSEYDFNKFENIVQRLEANLYRELSDSKLSIDEIVDQKKKGTLAPLSEDAVENSRRETELRRRLKDLRNPLLERKFKSEYYSQFENKLSDLGISEEGVKFVMNYYGDMSQFKSAAQKTIKDENGNDKMIMDFSQLSEQDKAIRDRLIKDRNNAKSYYNEIGELKKGLEFDRDGNIVPSDDVPLSKEAQIAIDLQKLDDPANRDTSLNTETAGIPPIFIDTLRNIENTEGREAAIEFLFMNSFIGFTDEYWEQTDLAGGGGLVQKLETLISQTGAPTPKDVLANIKKDRDRMKSILKVYRSKNNPSEIDVDSMPRATRDTVKTIQQRLVDRYRQARELTKDIKVDTERNNDGGSSVNEAYFKKLEDLDALIDIENDNFEEIYRKLKEEVEFATEHMTEANRNSVNTAVESLRLLRLGKSYGVNSLVEKTAKDMGIEDVLSIEAADEVAILQKIMRERMLPYYTRFAPNQYNEFMKEITRGEENLADLIPSLSDRFNFMEINPNYSFFDNSQNENINPNFVENFEGGYLQPKKQLTSDAVNEVVSGIQNADEQSKLRSMLSEGGLGFSSKKYRDMFQGNTNSNLYKAYQATLDYNRQSLEAMGVGNSYNMYTIPQIRQNAMERYIDLAKGASLTKMREAFTEAMSYTTDDKVQGERSKFGDSIKIIPKMYVDRVDNADDVSTELFYSLTVRAREAYQREARVEHYGDFMAIYDKILNRTYKGGDSKGENTIKMFESAMDYSLFGIKETATYPIETAFGSVDIAKIARNVLGFVKFRNLGLNVIIPITSYLTGRATREIEKWVGEHMDRRSQVLGDKEFRKHAREAITEIGEINTRSKLAVMGQYFGAFDLAESFNNSNYGKYMRFLPRTGMMLHTGANFPIYGSTMLGVLHDFRIVNGSIMRFNQFERQKLSEGVDKKEIKNQWDSLESEALYNFIDVNDAQIEFNDKAIRNKVLNSDGNKMNDAEYEAFKEEKINTVRAHISNVITNIDGQIPNEARVHAQRHFALNYFMTHRGWLSIVASRRFKNRHLNVETGEVEEGSYRTVWNFMGKYLKEYRKGNFTDFVKSWKNVYDNADPAEAQLIRRNMKRVGIEMSILNGLMLIGFVLNGIADDDEFADNYGIQGLSYLFNRTLNEMSSAQLGSINNFSEVIESPFVGWNTVKTFTDVGDLFSGEEVKYGSYRGLSERQRFLTKLVPGAKQVYDLSDAGRVKQMRNTYMFYNNANFNYTPLGNLYWLGEKGEE